MSALFAPTRSEKEQTFGLVPNVIECFTFRVLQNGPNQVSVMEEDGCVLDVELSVKDTQQVVVFVPRVHPPLMTPISFPTVVEKSVADHVQVDVHMHV